ARFPDDGVLRAELPTGASSDTYRCDPNQPRRDMTSLAAFAWSDPPLDSRYLLRRHDTLTYTSVPFDNALHVTGRIETCLYVSSDCADTDIHVCMYDVHPDGRTIQLGIWDSGGALR